MEKQLKKDGITLISLVITIIILLILAGVAIALAVDAEGLFPRAEYAKDKWNNKVAEEEAEVGGLLGKLEEMVPEAPKPMVTKWNIEEGDEVEIGLSYGEEPNVNVEIDWGDGTVEKYTGEDLVNLWSNGYGARHTYEKANADTTITMTGTCDRIDMSGNDKLTSIESWGNTESSAYDFQSCSNLTKIASPEEETFAKVTSFSDAFSRCSSLAAIPEDLFANCPKVTDFSATFDDCSSLANIPSDLFSNCPKVTSFLRTFSRCKNLEGNAIPLWERVEEDKENYIGTPDGVSCYAECEKLSDYESIPEYWKKELDGGDM